MERNDNICPQTSRQTIKQILNSKTEAHSNPLWIVGERANILLRKRQLKLTLCVENELDVDQLLLHQKLLSKELQTTRPQREMYNN